MVIANILKTKKALLQDIHRETSSAARLSFFKPLLKTLYFAPPDRSGFAFIGIIRLLIKNPVASNYSINQIRLKSPKKKVF